MSAASGEEGTDPLPHDRSTRSGLHNSPPRTLMTVMTSVVRAVVEVHRLAVAGRELGSLGIWGRVGWVWLAGHGLRM
jgi:hypothetical protein